MLKQPERDVPLEDIRQHGIHDCQEIEQHCGFAQPSVSGEMRYSTSQSAQKKRYGVPVGNNSSER